MARLSDAELYAIAEETFGDLGRDTVDAMFNIAKAESGGDTNAHNNRGEDSRGPWQINVAPNANPDLARFNLFDPRENARAARIVLDRQGLGAWTTYTQGLATGGANKLAAAGSQSMVTDTASGGSLDMLLGALIQQMLFGQADTLAGRALQAGELAGAVPGSLLGLEGLLPTLGREQFHAALEQADRQYQLDLARFGLEEAQFNYSQRVAEAQTKLTSMSLLASLRGPENALQHDFALAGLDAPRGREADPFGIAQGINQPRGQTSSTSRSPGGEATGDTQLDPQALEDSIRQSTQNVTRAVLTGNPATLRPGTPQFDRLSTAANTPGSAIQQSGNVFSSRPGTVGANSGFQGAMAGGTPLREDTQALNRSGMDIRVVNGSLTAVPKAEEGGVFPGMAVTGDSSNGRENRELSIAIGNRLIVIPLDDIEDAEGLPEAQHGGVFPGISTTQFGPEAFLRAPSVEALQGTRTLDPAAGQFSGETRGLPVFNQFHLGRFSRLLPSQRSLIQNIFESPLDLGGLGLDFGDNLEAARRASFSGSGAGVAGFGS